MAERILLIDDDADLLQGLKRRLRRKFDVTTAVGGEVALDLVRTEEPYTVAVSDMRMPGLSGIEVLQQLRKISPDTQRIMLTGNLDQETAVNAQITDAVTQNNVKVLAEAPAQSMALVYQTAAHSISLAMENAQQAQGGLQQIGNAVTSSAVTMIINAAKKFEQG